METLDTSNALTFVIISFAITGIVQLAKLLKLDPMLMLAGLSIIGAGIYQAATLYFSNELVSGWIQIAAAFMATANLIFNVMRHALQKITK